MATTKRTSPQRKNPLPLILGGVALVLVIVAIVIFHPSGEDSGPPAKHEVMITLPPPPPPPPPPKVEPPKPEEQKFEQEKAPTEKPPEKAPEAAPITTSIKGDGASGLGLGNGGGTGGFGGGGGGGSKYGYYAGQVQRSVAEVLRTNKKTRTAVMNVQVRLWADSSGKITRVSLAQSTGDPALDAAIRNEIFSDMALPEPPPEGMPMPIVMHFSAKRPN